MEMIKVKNLVKEYENFKLENFSIDVKEGQLYGILGPNGSGKSTVVKLLTGQIIPKSGEIKVLGFSPEKEALELKRNIGIIPEQETPPSFLTVKEYLEFVCKVRNLEKYEEKIEHWLNFLELKSYENNLIKDLSRGNKQKTLIAQAFLHSPKLVFIDEPLINLDPIIQKKIKDFLINYVKEKNTVFLSTHVLSIVKEICSDVCILKNGRVLLNDSMENVSKSNDNFEDFFIKLIENEK
ncbi:MAG: ABC transporter ATP-binding protein [Candidatus Nanoarchaeia archaeon]|nr:ABC transporter ATP-binding protein [Candidatus Nanoarchaeia archaeon]